MERSPVCSARKTFSPATSAAKDALEESLELVQWVRKLHSELAVIRYLCAWLEKPERVPDLQWILHSSWVDVHYSFMNCQFFATLILNNSVHWSKQPDEQSQLFASFKTLFKEYCFVPSASVEILSERMDQILAGISHVQVMSKDKGQ